MTPKSPDSLLRLAHKMNVVRERSNFPDPVIAHNAVYAGERDHDLVKFAWETLAPEWRVPAEGFEFWESYGNVILLFSFHTGRSRAMRPDGTVVWTLEPKGRFGWERWREHLYSVDVEGGIALADPATGQIVGRSALVPRPNEVLSTICEDVALVQDEHGDPFRAYDLRREKLLWECNLLADMKAKYNARDDVPFPLIKSSGPGLFVCRRGKGLYGFTLDDGQLRWGLDVVARTINTYESRIYVWGATSDVRADRFLCLDAATGALIYEVPVKARGPRPGAMSERHIAYAERSGSLVLFRLSDGALVWSYQHKQWLGGPVIAANRLFVGAEDGNLLVFEGDI